MKLKEFIKKNGRVYMDHIRNGKVIGTRDITNTITNAGLAAVADLILLDNPGSTLGFDHIAIGTGTTGATSGDTTLEAEISTGGGSRVAGTGTRVTTAETNDTAQLEVTYTFSSSFAVTETGMFNAASSGVMLARTTFSAVNVVSSDQLTIRWKIQNS